MQDRLKVLSSQRVVSLLLALLLSSCGGGSGVGELVESVVGSKDRISASFAPEAPFVEGVEGIPYELEVAALIAYTGSGLLYLQVSEGSGMVADAAVTQIPGGVTVRMKLSTALPAGSYRSVLQIKACSDEGCSKQISGSPMSVPLRFDVKPQIKIESPKLLSRTGREPAPSQDLALEFRPEMGDAELKVSGAVQAFHVEMRNGRILVNTRQLPEGRYNARVVVTGSANPLYRAEVDLIYVVEAPAGGEKPLRLSPFDFSLSLVQGTVQTFRFKVEKATWSDEPLTLTVTDDRLLKSVRSLGNDEYEMTVDSRGVPAELLPRLRGQSYYSSIAVRAQEFGGAASLNVQMTVDAAVRLTDPNVDRHLTSETPLSALTHSTDVLSADAVAVRWSATSDKPWLKLIGSSGTTGQEPLQFEIDRSVVQGLEVLAEATITLSLDKPGTLPMAIPVIVNNSVARFEMASPGALTAATARVRIHGVVLNSGESLRAAGLLQVQGARLVGVSLENDSRFVGFRGVLAVDIADVVVGQAVVIRVASPIHPTQVVLSSPGALAVPSGFVSLPLGEYRAPTFAPGQRALVFAGADAVWRWPLGQTAWGSLQSVVLPGVIDASFAPDESAIFAVTANSEVVALAPDTMAILRRGTLLGDPGQFERAFDPLVPVGAAAMRFGADGRSLVSVRPKDLNSLVVGRGVGSLVGCPVDTFSVQSADIATRPCTTNPGSLFQAAGYSTGAALARSAHGGAISASFGNGQNQVYKGLDTQFVDAPQLPIGRIVVAVSDTGGWLIRDDGVLIMGGNPQTLDLKQTVPSGHMAGGFGLAGDGRFALVYGYRIVSEPAGPRARDAALHLIDLRSGAVVLQGAAVAMTSVSLLDAVGCNTALASTEVCVHTASVVVAPGDASAIVLGVRGVAAVALPHPFQAQSTNKKLKGFRKSTVLPSSRVQGTVR